MIDHFPQHDLGALENWEAGNPGADRGKCDGAELPLGCDSQAMRRRRPQRARRSLASQLHARRMNHVARAKLASRGNRCAADRYGADGVAFPLNRFAALAPDRARDPAAKLQDIVRGIDDGVDVHLGQIALHEDYLFTDLHEHFSAVVRSYLAILASASSS